MAQTPRTPKKAATQAVDFSAVITDLDDKPIPFGEGPDAPVLTLGRVSTMSLLAETPDKQADAMESAHRWSLVQKIHNATEPVSLKAEDIVLLRKVIQPGWALLVRNRASDLLPE